MLTHDTLPFGHHKVPLHHGIDLRDGSFFTDRGDVKIDHGAGQLFVSEILLDQLEANARFVQMGGVAVSKRVSRDTAVAPVELMKDRLDNILNRRFAHRSIRRRCQFMISTFGRKNPSGIAMRRPVLTQKDESRLWQGNESIFGTFATVDVNQHPLGVDIGNLEMQSFLQPESE